MNRINFGVFISMEQSSFSEILSQVKLCERFGYHSIWLSDHLIGMYGSLDSNRFENWTTLSALAGATSRIRLGQLVLCNPFRHPSLLAKMSATLDEISGGRLELGIGAGWRELEFKAYGYPFESPTVRIQRLSEAVQIIKKMWTESNPRFEGRHYSIHDAHCFPKPVQKPHPPLMIGGQGEQLMLKLVARHADVCNFSPWMGRSQDYLKKLKVLNRYCKRIGRDPTEIRRSWASYVLINEDEEEAEKELKRYMERRASHSSLPPQRLRPPISGTPTNCLKQIFQYVDIGVSLFILRFMGNNTVSQIKTFAEKVISNFG